MTEGSTSVAPAHTPRGERGRRWGFAIRLTLFCVPAILAFSALMAASLATSPSAAPLLLPWRAPARGTKAPETILATLDGDSIYLSQLRGRIVVLAFWATWCAPCRRELEELDAMARRFGEDRLVVLAASIDERRADVDGYVADHASAYTVCLATEHARAHYHVSGVPATYVVDAAGVLAATPRDRDRLQLTTLIEGLLGAPQRSDPSRIELPPRTQ